MTQLERDMDLMILICLASHHVVWYVLRLSVESTRFQVAEIGSHKVLYKAD